MNISRRLGVLLFLGLATVPLVVGVRRARAQSGDNQQATKDVIINRARGFLKALNEDDSAFFNDYFTSDYTHFFPDHVALDQIDAKERVQSSIRSDPGHYRDVVFGMAHERVQLYGDTAVLTYNLSTTSSYKLGLNQRVTSTLSHVTDVYVRQQNVWRLAHDHSSSIEAGPT